ncbi:MAG: hypothetical protein JNJ45_08500 [Chthonomonas sp.]|nr:hypothetical protein [Chthonomonas sp.]
MSLDRDTIQQSLRTAREFGLRVVKLQSGDDKFRAVLSASVEADEPETEEFAAVFTNEPDPIKTVCSPVVGFMKAAKVNLKVGGKVEAGQVIGEVMALGLANDIVCDHAGEITEVLAKDGEPLEYGGGVIRVKVTS